LKPPAPVPVFAPGFRLSFRDALVLVIGIGGSTALGKNYWPASLLIAVAVGNFFLFCNVFRISRCLELVWAGIFIALCGMTVWMKIDRWSLTVRISIFVTAIVVLCETRKPSYHGVGWQKINPRLKNWWHSDLQGKG
jgi:hypothetical protein